MKHPRGIRCGAKTRTPDQHPCRRWARANGRCNLHGGKSRVGIAHPRFKHGGYSVLMSLRLAGAYRAALEQYGS